MSRSLSSLTQPHGPGLTDAARVVACGTAVFFVGAGVIHVSAAADHTNLPVMMVGFLCVATLQVTFGALLVWRRPGRLLLAAGLVLMLGSVAMWLVSRTAGLPFLPGGHVEPVGFKDGVTVLFELASLPGLLLLGSRDLQGSLPSPRLGERAIGGLASAAFVLFVPAIVLGGGEHHSASQFAALSGHSHQGGDEHAPGDGHGEKLAFSGGAAGAKHHSHQGGAGAKDRGHHGAAAAASGGGRGEQAHAHSTASGLDGQASSLGHDHGVGTATVARGAAGGEAVGGHHGGGGGHDSGATLADDKHSHGGDRGGGEHDGGSHGDEHDGGGQGGEHSGGHGGGGGGGPDGDQDGRMPGPDDPGGVYWGAHRLDYEPAQPGSDGEPGRGTAFVYRGPADPNQGTVGHHSDKPCQPTRQQRIAARRLYRDTAAALRKYDNNPARALADGFYYVFPVSDRIIHMVHPPRVSDPTILDAGEIESFLYAMTDRGLVAIGGMYIMPEAGMRGPRIGGCRTQWHEHAGLVGLAVSAGTMRRTPEMLHVWTYPGLDPYGHYDGRTLSQLWQGWSWTPSVCRESGDSSDACLP